MDEFIKWLWLHTAGRKMLNNVKESDYDLGYIKACEVISAEYKRLSEEHTEGDGLRGTGDILEEKVP